MPKSTDDCFHLEYFSTRLKWTINLNFNFLEFSKLRLCDHENLTLHQKANFLDLKPCNFLKLSLFKVGLAL